MPKKKKKQQDEELIIGYNNPKKDKTSKRSKKKKWNRIKKMLILILKIVLILAVILGILIFLFISPVFNIVNIRVENAEKISENTYIALSEIQIGENIFKISKTKVKSLIKTEPYVESIEVKRELPGTILLKVKERKPQYMLENAGIYVYIDKNGYILETNAEPLEVPIIKGIVTKIEELDLGERISEEDLLKFNDLIKITDSIKSNNIEQKLTSVDISDDKNYILEFGLENKKVMLGDVSDLSTKMLWIKYFIKEKSNEGGIIHLEVENVYFTPQ